MSPPFSPKTPTSPPQEIWLLDATGQILDHDPLGDRIIRKPFDARTLPGLSLILSAPLPQDDMATPVRARFQKRVSLPFPLPDVELTFIPPTLVALHTTEEVSQDWLGEPSDTSEAHFISLTKDGFLGLAMLFNPVMAKVTDSSGADIAPANFVSDIPYGFALGTIAFSLSDNLNRLIQLGHLPQGQETQMSLQQVDTHQEHSFTIRRSS